MSIGSGAAKHEAHRHRGRWPGLAWPGVGVEPGEQEIIQQIMALRDYGRVYKESE